MYIETLIDRRQLGSAAKVMASQGMSLVTMVVTDERHRGNGFGLRYVFAEGSASGSNGARQLTCLRARIPGRDPTLPSITPAVPAANWYEREAHDMFGLSFVGHPDPRPLVYHGAWPSDSFPLRKDFSPPQPRDEGEAACGCPHDSGYRFGAPGGSTVADELTGAMQVPVGPIHAGIIEPGHFRFTTVGEDVRGLEARLFFTHRGIEKAAEGLELDAGLALAERVCGACSFSHALSYCQAAEEALQLSVPRRARQLRTIVMELERLYNHVGDLGNICAGVGYAFGISQLGILKERLMEGNEMLCGSRFLRGIAAVGGLRLDIPFALLEQVHGALSRILGTFRGVMETMAESDSFQDRAVGTGKVTTQQAIELAAVGVAARGSNIHVDARREFPHAAYDEASFEVPVELAGDVAARIAVRVREVHESKLIIDQLLSSLVDGPIRHAAHETPAGVRVGMGISESARGSNVHWLMLDEAGRIERLRVRSASFCNWPLLPLAAPDNIVPDFPLINKSFELCYSCLDR